MEEQRLLFGSQETCLAQGFQNWFNWQWRWHPAMARPHTHSWALSAAHPAHSSLGPHALSSLTSPTPYVPPRTQTGSAEARLLLQFPSARRHTQPMATKQSKGDRLQRSWWVAAASWRSWEMLVHLFNTGDVQRCSYSAPQVSATQAMRNMPAWHWWGCTSHTVFIFVPLTIRKTLGCWSAFKEEQWIWWRV